MIETQRDHLNRRTIVAVPDELFYVRGVWPEKGQMPADLAKEIVRAAEREFKDKQQPMLQWARKSRAENDRKRLLRRG